MARLSMSVLTTKGEDSALFKRAEKAAKKSRLSATSICKPYKDILKEVEDWAILPEIVLFDIPDDIDVFTAVEDISDRFPEGDLDMILTGVENDIMTYRRLKSMGISEIFPKDPSEEEIETAIEEIAMRELRATEIDPRRAVYVWGSSGGSGSTTVALAFARHLSKEGQRTLFIDMDIFATPASYLLGAKEGAQETYGLIEALMNPQRIDSVFLERAIHKVDKNLFYLSARKKPSDKNFDPSALSVLISRAQKNFDIVVIDTPWRPLPEADWGKVNGTSFIIGAPTAQAYLGFTTIAKELASTPSKSPVYGIVNRSGEFRSNDFTPKMFSAALDGEVYSLPYDGNAVGKLFFAQKTLLDAGGKIAGPFKKVTGLLPRKTDVKSPSKSRKGFDFSSLLGVFK